MNPQMFNVLSEPNRLDIVELLYKNPQSVNEIVFKLKLNQPQVSKHLKILASAGIVDVKPIKNQRIYGLKSQPFKELDTWLEKYRKMWDQRFDRLDEILKKEVKKNDGK
jgi:DNA-binding transcriptional ArsR family regulator